MHGPQCGGQPVLQQLFHCCVLPPCCARSRSTRSSMALRKSATLNPCITAHSTAQHSTRLLRTTTCLPTAPGHKTTYACSPLLLHDCMTVHCRALQLYCLASTSPVTPQYFSTDVTKHLPRQGLCSSGSKKASHLCLQAKLSQVQLTSLQCTSKRCQLLVELRAVGQGLPTTAHIRAREGTCHTGKST